MMKGIIQKGSLRSALNSLFRNKYVETLILHVGSRICDFKLYIIIVSLMNG